MKATFACVLLSTLCRDIVAPPARLNKQTTEESVDRMPEPEYWLYLRQIATILEKSKFNDKVEVFTEKSGGKTTTEIKALVNLFNELPPGVKIELNNVKRTEIDRLRRKFIPRKKGVQYKDDDADEHVNMDDTSFGVDDIIALTKANKAHYDKYEKMRKEDFKRYEMEKKFLAEQKARHINDEKKRKEYMEQVEKERAEYAAAKKKEKAPLTKEEIKEVWKDKDELPENEFNPKTFFALHDVDSNGLLDMDEVRVIIANEVNKTFAKTSVDHRERVEETERMRNFIYKKVDKNGDLMIDLEELMDLVNDNTHYENDDDWKDDEDRDDEEYDDEEFRNFEKEKIDHIREDFGQGKKPDGYNFEDVPLLDGNFINETHVKVGNMTFKANNASRDERIEAFKKYEMEKKFEMEQKIQDMTSLAALERDKLQHDLDAKYFEGSHGLNKKQEESHLNKPLSPEQLEAVWEEQDHKTKEEWNATTFFHLHDVNTDSFIDEMELRMMLITELNKETPEIYDEVEKEEEMERMREEVMERSDKNKDGKLDMREFLDGVEPQVDDISEHIKDKNDARKLETHKYWKTLHEETQITPEEYNTFREQRTMEIRKMIADGKIPENFNYSHVPLLQGNFINATHIQRGLDLIHIHEQDDKQRRKDFKKFKMESRFAYEQKLKKLTPEERAVEEERVRKLKEEWKMKMENLHEPLSEKQVKEVWEEEDKMEKEAYSGEKFFRIHDVNEDGKWDKQEIRQILLRDWVKAYGNDTMITEEEKLEKLERWREEVFKNFDTNKDGAVSQQEFSDNNKDNREAKWKEEEESPEYTEEEYEKFIRNI